MTDLSYDFDHLDSLMEEAGLDVILVTSKHNAQYLMGGYKFIFFSAMDAIGHGRYLPVVVYFKGQRDRTAYIANKMEKGEHENAPLWVPHFYPMAWGSVDSITQAISHLHEMGFKAGRIGIEPPFLPSDSKEVLLDALPDSEFINATSVLENLRAVKSMAELSLLREASEKITASMQATIAASGEGSTKHEIIELLRQEETKRGLQFDYCLLTLGASHNRAGSDQAWAKGDILSIDSGGNLCGYIGDICRMGVLGEPDAELVDLLGEIQEIQQAAFAEVRAGAAGGHAIAAGQAALANQPNKQYIDFFGHGMGLVSHEAPFLLTNHPVAYEGRDADKPLKAGMVLSIETHMQHPKRGFIKLEDTLAVTETGYEMFGTEGRGWNRSDKF
ncbi:Xaa-Pro peptidase family protein [Sulfitobacter sp. F26204]|uniref:M24 family metallopeptidase n=1 Tax=Sulfitobacter sp. F26204 TaxID=2996014 RepID=UPI00225E06F4|nr:Xaa-Pro peptidase family protein [Sulfitobacter sp. F26204]MCX7558393.1 Xaa-Pro peptidase family protein [Sulfitobacter sp. F26204]